MREIKFRAWDGNEMHDVGTLDLWSSGAYTVNENIKNPNLMQYTGLTDGNATEIWEGDLVKGMNGNEGGPSEVFYDYGVWQPFDFIGVYDGSKFEVVGNIYENPELLAKTH